MPYPDPQKGPVFQWYPPKEKRGEAIGNSIGNFWGAGRIIDPCKCKSPSVSIAVKLLLCKAHVTGVDIMRFVILWVLAYWAVASLGV